MPAGKTRRPGCENCRARHLKCDRGVPCAPCAKKGLTCQRPQKLRFSHSSYSNRDASLIRRSTRKLQRTIPRQRIQFVDQTIETVRSYDAELNEHDQFYNGTNGPGDLPSDAQGSADEDETSEDIDPRLAAVNNATWQTPNVAALPDLSNDSISNHDLITGLQTWCYQNLSSGESPGVVGNLGSPLSLSSSKPYHQHSTIIASQIDAKLADNFLENIGPALDPWDDCRRLSADLVELAAEHPDLLETLLTVSATHISSLGAQIEMKHNVSFQKRLSSPLTAVRVPAVGPPTAKSMALLQRTLHNITGSAFESGNESVADGIWATQHSHPHYVASLESKVTWAGLWQEMFLSVIQQRPVNIKISHPCFSQDTQGNDDRSWANRMLLHLLDAIQYCFGEERSPAAYDRLVSYLATWAESKPASFRPLFIRKSLHGKLFPEIWLLNSAVVAGLQWYHLVRILLLANNPRLPQLGAAKRSAKRSRDDQIRDDVSVICGIAESMEETTPAHLTACMAITLVGDRFRNHDEQVALLNILDKANAKFGWSTISTKEDLKETWSWNPNS